METQNKSTFPRDFLFGSATSAHQVEGGNTNNDWWDAETRGLVKHRSGLAADHFHRYEEDFDILRNLSQNAYRLSLEWSRIEPREGEFNHEAIGYYRHVLTALRRRGITPMVTLHHFTNPRWLAKQGGWESPAAPILYARYIRRVVQEFHDLVHLWVTFNEPMVYIVEGYWARRWPPFHRSVFRAWRVYRNLRRAHTLAYQAIRHIEPGAAVGTAQNMIDLVPRRTLIDAPLTALLLRFWNFSFIRNIPYDFIGVNYYFHHHVKWFGQQRASESGHPVSDVGWGVHPEGLYRILVGLQKYHKPIYITENGIADANDQWRGEFIRAHLVSVQKAIREGIDIRGYFYWSLLDNFEWEKGFGPRFGLVAIDYHTLERRIRPSAYVYAYVCKNRSL
jgi:beta-glucosidase